MDKVRLEVAVTASFLGTVMKKFHFGEEEREAFLAVGREVEAAACRDAGFWCIPYEGKAELAFVVLTLGAGVDALQERYTREGRLSECYMAETIAGEVLLTSYRQFNAWMEAQNGQHVARYYFFGSFAKTEGELTGGEALMRPETLSLEAMSEGLRAMGLTEVQCNQACCLTPKKSVVFLAELTDDADVRCEGICAGCSRKDCGNRCVKEQEEERLRWPDFAQRALPYGYSRILGR